MTVIHVGSTNPTKVQAAQNVFSKYEAFKHASVIGVVVEVEEFGHPKSLEETIKGAKDRAKAAYDGADFGVGLESGLLEAPGSNTGYVEAGACAIYDGKKYAIGLSPAFEWPKAALALILQGHDGSQAFKEIGLTNHEKVGTATGAIHVLSHGLLNRTMQNELAIQMALVQLENPEYY